MNPVSNVLWGYFRSAVKRSKVLCWYHMAQHFARYSTLKVRSAVQCAVAKTQPTQWDGMGDSTTALLFLKINNSTHTHIYACAYRGNIDPRFEVLSPSLSVSA
jgi:hypothetical protein